MSGASYDVGSAFISVIPSFDGAVTAIAAQAADWGTQAGEAFAETFKQIVNNELKDMNAVRIDADTSEASAKAQALRAEIAELKATVDINVDETDVQEKLGTLEAELAALELEHPEIRVGVDAGDAEAELGGVVAEATAADAALTSVGGDGAATEGLDAAGASAAGASTEISGMAAAVAFLGVALLPIGGLALGAFAAIPAILSGAITAVAALYAGLEPIITTLEAFGTRNAPTSGGGTSAASTAQSNATAQRNAAYSVQQAQEALTNSEVNGAAAVTQAQEAAANATESANNKVISANQALVSSEEAVTQAQFNEQQAQEAVVAARQAAANQLTDYTDQLADNAISAQQDALNLSEAQAAYAQATQPGSTATYDQQQQAAINLAQAQQAQQDLSDQNSQLQTTATAAFAAGVDGAQSVIVAENQLEQATQAVATAIQSQQNAQTAVTQANAAAAQQQITNENNIAKAQKDNAQGVSNAEKALEQALANQKDAFTKAAIPVASGSVGVRTYAQDLAKLSPAGQEFVQFVENQLLPAFDGVKTAAQDGLLPGLQAGLTDALPFFKDLTGFIGDAATGIGDLAQAFGNFAGSSTGLAQLQEMFQNGNQFMADLGQAAQFMLGAFVGVGAQSGPIINALGSGIIKITEAFDNWVNDGGFQGFLTWLRQNGPELVSDLSAMFKAVGDTLVALTPLGVIFDNFIGYLSDAVTWVTEAWQRFGPLALVIGTVGTAIVLLTGGPFVALIAAVTLLVAGIATLGDHWQQVWADIKTWTADAWTAIDVDFVQPWVTFFTKTIPDGFDDFVNYCKALPGRALAALGDVAKYLWGGFIIDQAWLATNIGDPIVNFFTGLPEKIGNAAVGMWDGIEAAFVNMLDDIIGIWNDFHFTLPHVSFLGATLGGNTIGVPQIPLIPIPKYHTGGVVQGTAGVETLAMLMPGELVVPAGANLSGLAGGAGSSPTIIINGVDLENGPFVQKVVTDALGQFFDDMGKAA